MSEALRSAMPMNISFLSEYPDFFAFGIVILLGVLLAAGVRESTLLNNLFTIVNLITVAIIIVAGSLNADPGNWFIAEGDIPEGIQNAGTGGFMPFGMKGVLSGAATCFYGFIGFDVIATTGEEAKSPQKNIPWAIVVSLTIIFCVYFGISTILTMMWPYYDQYAEAPFPYVFEQIGLPIIKWIVNIGPLFALCTSLLGAMFPLPRVLYAMANDGILFKFFGIVNARTQTPLAGTIVSGIFAGCMTIIFNLSQLVHMMSIGTLMAYGVVALSVLILRYQPELQNSNIAVKYTKEPLPTFWIGFKQIFNLNDLKEPTQFSSRVASWGIVLYSILVLIFGLALNTNTSDIMDGHIGIILVLSILGLIMVLIVIAIGRQPVLDTKLAFKVPLVPLLPCVSIFLNIYLMLQLDKNTWIRFIGWMIIGFIIYFSYGIRNSVQGAKDKIEQLELAQRNRNNDRESSRATVHN